MKKIFLGAILFICGFIGLSINFTISVLKGYEDNDLELLFVIFSCIITILGLIIIIGDVYKDELKIIKEKWNETVD